MNHAGISSLIAFSFMSGSASWAQPTAEYRVTLDANPWSVETHPGAFPPAAHFSPFVGAVHDETYSMWEPQTIASDGMEDMAEDGETTVLAFEVISARSQGRATELLRGPFLFAGEAGGDTFTAEATHPLLTVVSMIAPSPDWFVGVSSFDLRPDGQWLDRAEIELHAYDAGTDSGVDFQSGDLDTQPREPIENISSLAPFTGTPHVALLVIERTDAPCLADVNMNGVAEPTDFGAWLAAYNNDDPAADQNQNGSVEPTDFGAWLANYNAGCD